MKINFKWTVDKIAVAPKLDDFENVVTKVSYSYIAFDEDSNESISYPIEYEPEAPNKVFKSFEELKEDEVISWVVKSYDLTAIESYLIKQIELKLGNKYTPVDLPWSKKEVEISPTDKK